MLLSVSPEGAFLPPSVVKTIPALQSDSLDTHLRIRTEVNKHTEVVFRRFQIVHRLESRGSDLTTTVDYHSSGHAGTRDPTEGTNPAQWDHRALPGAGVTIADSGECRFHLLLRWCVV